MDWRSTFAVRRIRARRQAGSLAGPESLEGRALLAADPLCLSATALETPGWEPPPAAEILPTALPNDPSFSLEWGLLNAGQYSGTPGNDIGATGAWEFTTGSRSVVVAVIDSGIDLTHPDLAANLWVNPGEMPGDGIDNDGNGFVDDVHGWDFVDNDATPQDGFGHGTGVTGVNWQVSIMVLRVENDQGVGYTSAAVAALRYATMMRRDYGIMVVASNNSWEAASGYSPVVEQAIREHGEAGIMFVSAAGNNAANLDVTPKYPACYDLPNVISVASLTPQGQLAASSNYGATAVDVAAPGTLVQSTYKGGTYAGLSGTSMAAPHVTGVVALVAAARPGITAAEIRTAILGTAAPLASLAGKVASGRLDARAALASLGVPPVAPPAPVPAPAPQPAPQPGPVVSVVTLPFSDEFAVADGPLVSPDWTIRSGSPAVLSGSLVSRSVGPSLVTVRGITVGTVSLQGTVDVRAGGRVGLVARHDPATGDLVMAEIARTSGRFRGRILVLKEGAWHVLASHRLSAGLGTLRFDVAGDTLQLVFNGKTIISTRASTIPAQGGIGLQIAGTRPRIGNFAAATRA